MRRRAVNIEHEHISDVFDGLRADYQIGKESRYLPRMLGVDSAGSGADYHYSTESQFFKGMERARWFDRENMVIGQGLTRLIDNVLQDKIPLDPDTKNSKLDDELYDRWEDWCYSPVDCHSRKTHDFHSLAKLILRAVIVDGDILNLPLKSGQLQPIEAHRLRTPQNSKKNVIHGVEVDGLGAPLRYYVADDDQSLLQRIKRVGDVKQYDAFTDSNDPAAFHVFNPKRVSQTRGVTAFAPLVFPAGIHDDLQFAKLVQAQVASCFALIHEQSPTVTPPTSGIAATGASTTETQSDGSSRLIQGIAPGMTYYAKQGEKVTGFSPNVPNAEFFKHAMMILTIVAVNLGIPVAVLLLDPSNTNFSGWRGAIDQARVGFKEIQRWMVQRFFSPVYRWQVRRWLDADPSLARLARKSRTNPFRHKFNRPKWAYIEPLKDAQADELRLGANLISHTELCDERGDDWDDRVRQIVEDRAKLITLSIETAEEINTAHPDAKVHWRDLAAGKMAELPQQTDAGNEATGQQGGEAE